jgi:hypothetical protein
MHDRETRLATFAAKRQERFYMSVAAGRSFGHLWYLNHKGMTIEQAEQFADSLHPKSPLFSSVYKRSFVEAFIESHNRDLANGN